MEKNKDSKYILKNVIMFAFLFLVAGVITFGGCLLFHTKTEIMIRNLTMVLLGTSIVSFSYFLGELKELFYYDNYGKYYRFVITLICCLIGSVFLPYLPVAGWPFLFMYVMLGLFSNAMTGFAAGSICLFLSVSLSNGNLGMIFTYFLSGLVGVYVFSTLNDEFKVGMPMTLALSSLMLCFTANIILFENVKLSAAQFIIPSINVFVCLILLLIILKVFSSAVIYKYRDKYMEINDPECPLLVELKDTTKDEYYHAIHTAYLSDKIGKRLHLDEAAIKACGYYHRIGKLRGENTWGNVEQICNEYRFPPQARKILREYVDSGVKIQSKETVVVLFADCIVSAILYLFEKDPKAEIDYKQLIDAVFKKKLETNELWSSRITLEELQEMHKIFLEEKLYYDFLR